MAFPKTELFPADDQHVSNLGRALGHPARAYILRLLVGAGDLYFHEIVYRIPLTAGTVSEHLKKLRHAGLVKVEEVGLLNRYTLDSVGIRRMLEKQVSFAKSLINSDFESTESNTGAG